MKNDVLLMAVDLGTSFIKTGIYDTDGNCLAVEKEAVEDEKPKPGVVIQRGEKLFESVVRCLKKTSEALGEEANKVEAMAFTGQMAGFMGVDKDWNDITTWSCFIDGRYVPYADRQMSKYADDFLRTAGTNSPLMAPKIEWFAAEYPEESKKIAKYLMISGYVIGKLAECDIEDATMDHSFLTWTGLGDIGKQCWSKKMCDMAGADIRYLPRIVRSNEICGHLSERMAGIIGLKSGIPLVSGAGDKVAGNVGACVLNKGDAIFEAGTYGAYSCMVDEFIPNLKNNYYDVIPAAVDGLYTHKYIPGSGMTLEWFTDTFMKDKSQTEALKELEEKVPQISAGCEGLMAIGLLGGNAMPFDGEIRGMWMGHSWSHKREHFYRALLESFAYDLALTAEATKEMYPDIMKDTIKVIGGGARSDAWLHILADVTGLTFIRMDRDDPALWGAAILAGNAVGIFDDIKKTAESHIKEKKRVEPDLQKTKEYKDRKELYKEYTKKLHDFYIPIK